MVQFNESVDSHLIAQKNFIQNKKNTNTVLVMWYHIIMVPMSGCIRCQICLL